MQKEFIDKVKKLSISERMIIIEDIWDSIISSNKDIAVTEEQKKDLDQRLADYYDNPSEGSTWDEVKKRIRAKL